MPLGNMSNRLDPRLRCMLTMQGVSHLYLVASLTKNNADINIFDLKCIIVLIYSLSDQI